MIIDTHLHLVNLHLPFVDNFTILNKQTKLPPFDVGNEKAGARALDGRNDLSCRGSRW